MSFISLHFAALVCVLLFCYYSLPKRFQPYLLLAGSLYFYYRCSGLLLFVMAGTSLLAWFAGRYLYKKANHSLLCMTYVSLIAAPLLLVKVNSFCSFTSPIVPVGVSFYTLQLIAYCMDVYHGKHEPEKNFLYFLLFTSFFPQILQGPIPRYSELKETLLVSHDFDEETLWNGMGRILSGLFLKLVLADKMGILVNTVFSSVADYDGAVILTAGCLYSLQLYTDFLSCVLLAQGIALLFGVRLSENFARPYFSVSIKDFWRRWHISLSSWLRDYIYIPLGGNRKGTFRTNCNLLLTFLVSGLWHGDALTYVVWGMMHGLYQFIGKYTDNFRNHFFTRIHCPATVRLILRRLTCFFLVMMAWIMFRAASVKEGIAAWQAIFTRFRLESFTDGQLLCLGLSPSELLILFLFLVLFFLLEYKTEHGYDLFYAWQKKSYGFRFISSLLFLLMIFLFGTYGVGYDAGAFIYGGF